MEYPLMKHLLPILLLLSCARHQEQETRQDLADVQRERDQIVAAFDPATITRCDYLTFAALLEAFTVKGANVAELEHPVGMWHRNFKTCYPNDSASETSRDGYIAVLHLAQSHHDAGLAQRIIDYAEPQGWITGPGPEGVTGIGDLEHVARQIADAPPSRDEERDIIPPSTKHVLGLILYLRGRVFHGLSSGEALIARELARAEPEDPFFQALHSRFDDQDYGNAIEKLQVMPRIDAPFGWGSCPWPVYYAMTVAVMEGL
jgi:hypothetical protein